MPRVQTFYVNISQNPNGFVQPPDIPKHIGLSNDRLNPRELRRL